MNIKEISVMECNRDYLYPGISVVLLAYQEAENLKILIPKIQEQLDLITRLDKELYEVIVVDTAQPMDETPEICRQLGCRYVNQEEPHFGGAFRTGIKYASYDKFLILDSDGSHNPQYIGDIYQKFISSAADVVIGSRYVKGGYTNDAKVSIVMSHILNTAFRLCLGIQAKDISTDYRIYHTADLKAVFLENKNYDVLQEVLVKISLNKPNRKLNIVEVPITFEKRMFGISKRKLIPFIIDYIKSLSKLTMMRFPTLYNLILYVGFGLVAACLEFVIFSLLVFSKVTSSPEIANVIGAGCGFLFTFSANTFLNFKKKDKLARRFGSYAAICVLGMCFSTGCMHLLKGYVNVYLLKICLLGAVSVLQFVLNKAITYSN